MIRSIFVLILMIITTLFTSELKAKNIDQFPLWGSSWIIAEGENPRIYPSVLPLTPKLVIQLNFSSLKQYVDIQYYNLNHRDYWGTSDVVDATLAVMDRNRIKNHYQRISTNNINDKNGLDIHYQIYNDTVWTLIPAILDLFQKEGFTWCKITQGTKVTEYERWSGGERALRQELENKTGYSKEKPAAWVRRVKSPDDVMNFKLAIFDNTQSKYFYYRQISNHESTTTERLADNSTVQIKSIGRLAGDDITEYCDDQYYYRKVTKYSSISENLGYWQVHVYPEVWYYPRDPSTGKPIIHDELKVSYLVAEERKKKSIDNPNNTELKYWRDPYLSDSASTIISFAFIEDRGEPLKSRESIWLSSIAAGSKIPFDHMPGKMYNWDILGRNALYMLYSKSPEEENFARTLDIRCGESMWKAIDLANSRIIFPMNRRTETTLNRDWSINDGMFMYNGCPCTREADLGNRTRAEVRKYIYLPVPTCNYDDMVTALNIYRVLEMKLTAPADQEIIRQRIRESSNSIQARRNIYAQIIRETTTGKQNVKDGDINTIHRTHYRQKEQGCPKVWTEAIKPR